MKRTSCFLLLFMTSCLASKLSSTKKDSSLIPTEIKGVVSLSNGTSLDLGDLVGNPLLLIFAQETCDVCRGETLSFKSEYESLTARNLNIVTVLAWIDTSSATLGKK